MKTPESVPHVTRKDIEEFLSLDEQRKAKNREADDLKKQQDVIREKLMTFVRAKGGKARSILRSGFVLAIGLAKGSVAWKEEFVKVAGLRTAEEIAAAAPPREVLSVEKAA